MRKAAEQQLRRPFIKRLRLVGLPAMELPPGALVFVVGPNNGGKSTFLTEIVAQLTHASNLKWIEGADWDVGSEEEYTRFLERYFKPAQDDRFVLDVTGNQMSRNELIKFPTTQKLTNHHSLIRLLDAQNRIALADPASGPDVISRTQHHPYHTFFYSVDAEEEFSKKMKSAFGRDFRINRSGQRVGGYLGQAPKGDRLSVEYEQSVLSLEPVQGFGDGVRSYAGILLNAIADSRPITIIDEPEAFLHPPQARRLGHEIALAAKSDGQQAFVATHSADFIQGALGAKNPNTLFLYVDHSNAKRPLYAVDRTVVEEFSKKPFLVHTNALDALFYNQAVICEGEADIMFFKWALQNGPLGKRLEESFWMSAYGKAAIPGILGDMQKLGVRCKCVFDLDVLLSPETLGRLCSLLKVDSDRHSTMLAALARAIRVPPASEALDSISGQISALPEDADDVNRTRAVREIKRSAERLGKSWVLKTSGLAALPKGNLFRAVSAFIEEMRRHGVLILEEGEIENCVPEIGGHGQSWVRGALEAGQLSSEVKTSLVRQFKAIL